MEQTIFSHHGFKTVFTTLENHHLIECIVKQKNDSTILMASETIQLYAPYRYHLHVVIPPQVFSFLPPPNVQLQIQILDAITGCEVLRNLEPVFKGATPVLLSPSKTKDVLFEHVGKFQIADCSYHHSMHPFSIRVTFLDCESNKVILIRESKPFLVKARSTIRKKRTKKDREMDEDEEKNLVSNEAPKASEKTVASSEEAKTERIVEFEGKLGKLLEEDFQELNQVDQRQAISFMLQRIQSLSADPLSPSTPLQAFDNSGSSPDESDLFNF